MLLHSDALVDPSQIFQNQIEPKCIFQYQIWNGDINKYVLYLRFEIYVVVWGHFLALKSKYM